VWAFRNKTRFYGEELAPRPTPKLEDHTLSAVRDYLFNVFAATLLIGGRSSILNLRMRHAVVPGALLSRPKFHIHIKWQYINFIFTGPSIIRYEDHIYIYDQRDATE
jgi:hypothetical protein